MRQWLMSNSNKAKIERLQKLRERLVEEAVIGKRDRERSRISLARMNRKIARLYECGTNTECPIEDKLLTLRGEDNG